MFNCEKIISFVCISKGDRGGQMKNHYRNINEREMLQLFGDSLIVQEAVGRRKVYSSLAEAQAISRSPYHWQRNVVCATRASSFCPNFILSSMFFSLADSRTRRLQNRRRITLLIRCPCVYIIDLYSHKHTKNLVKTLLVDLNAMIIQRIPKNILKSRPTLTSRRVKKSGRE